MKSKFAVILMALLLSVGAYAQEMLGIAGSNYAGNFGIDMNPASMAFSPIKYELNVLSGNLMFQNNYIYFPKGTMSAGKFFKGNFFDYDWQDNYTSKDKTAFMQGTIKGPSFFTRIGKTAFGLHTGLKSYGSVRNLDYELAKFFYENTTYVPLHHLNLEASNNKVAAIIYGEVGASVAHQMDVGAGNKVALGFTGNYLLGLDAFYIKNDYMGFKFDNEAMLHVADLQAEYGYAVPQQGERNYFNIRGTGFSTTWGLQYMHGLNPEAYNVYASRLHFKKYQYKAGISLVDAGSILFAKDARTVQFKGNNFSWDGFDTTHVESVGQLGELIRSKVFDDDSSGITSTKFRTKLPAAISAQFDYGITYFLYVNATIIQPVTSKANAIRRPAQLSVTPRLESWRYEISFPLSWYEYEQFRVGTCLRLGQVVIGTDYLTSMLGLSKFNGFDFYAGIKHSNYATDKLSKRKKVKDTYNPDNI
jgi:hypothetical protein